MKLGLLADIHEQTDYLRKAIDVLQQHGADRFVVLGDVFEMGKRIEETIHLLPGVLENQETQIVPFENGSSTEWMPGR
jgi:predicted phosphodiesterase